MLKQEYDVNAGNERKIERFFLTVYSGYAIVLMGIMLAKGLDKWKIAFLFIGIIVNWIIYIGARKTLRFRANFVSAIMQISAILYSIEMEELSSGLYIFITMAILLGLYNIKELIYLPALSTIFVTYYHVEIIESVCFESGADVFRIFCQVINVFVVEYVVYTWIKNRNKSGTKLLEALEALSESANSKEDFVANVSHEIRTPINTICGMSEIILRENCDEAMKEKVTRIHTAGQNLLTVVSDILDFSEIQSGKMEIVEEVYDITAVINDVIKMLEAKKKEKHIDLLVDCDANIPCGLLGDEKKIRRIIKNLLSNAIKFTEDGYVNLTVGWRKEAYGANLIVTVKDSGIGMKEENLEKIFSCYNQVDTKRNRQEGGIGLGLSISQAMVQKMGGVLTIKSRFGKGTEVKFVVPQKVIDERPIVNVKNREKTEVLFYLDVEQFELPEVRDEYVSAVSHMIEQLKISACICKDLGELKRRIERGTITHIFVSEVEYREAKEYMDELSKKMKLIVVANYEECMKLTNPDLLHIYKPFSVFKTAAALNGELKNEEREVQSRRNGKESFIAPKVRALVVDDNAMNLDVLQGLLSEYQIQVSVACSGIEALDKIDAMNYDFVFMDHMMPEMDGVETMRRIRKKVGNYFQRVPIIAVTANAVAGTRDMFIAEGFADFIEKPVEVSVLERVLKRTIPEKKLIFLENEKKENEENQQQKKEHTELVVGNLDVKKGMMYCGGKEKYLTILKKFCGNGTHNIEKIEELYVNSDWKNYIISIHAIKSSMYSIGALTLSEMAKQLEFAGKKENIEYIQQNHRAMVEEYKRVSKILQEHPLIGGTMAVESDCEEDISHLQELSEENFDAKFQELEAAMYALDEEKMKEILMQMQDYQYHGEHLKKKVEMVIGKVEMSDYMSAVEQVRTWKKDAGKED